MSPNAGNKTQTVKRLAKFPDNKPLELELNNLVSALNKIYELVAQLKTAIDELKSTSN